MPLPGKQNQSNSRKSVVFHAELRQDKEMERFGVFRETMNCSTSLRFSTAFELH